MVDNAPNRVSSRDLWLRIFSTIRNKIVLPFFLLTIVIAALGTFISTRLTASSDQTRLANQLIESSRASSDAIVGWENRHLEVLRLLAFTINFPQALQNTDTGMLNSTMQALASNQKANLILSLDTKGRVKAGVQRTEEGNYGTDILVGADLGDLPMIAPLLSQTQDQQGDKYAGLVKIDQTIYLVSTAPVLIDSRDLAGVIVVGTPLHTVLLDVKGKVLADLLAYQSDGQLLDTTLLLEEQNAASGLNIPPALFTAILGTADQAVTLREITANKRQYQVAYTPLKIRGQTLAVLGVALPTDSITNLIITNRNGLGVMFALMTLVVVLIGLAISQNIARPIQHLTTTAEAVSEGDLSRQSNIRSTDEIGILSRTFDGMTQTLSVRNQQLEEAYYEQEKEAAFLSGILNSTADGVVVIAPDGQVTRLNPVAKDIIVANRKLWFNELADLVKMVDASGFAKKRLESKEQWYEALASPVYTIQNERVGVVVSLRDVTEQELTQRMRTAFIMQISHELQTPLAAVKGYIDLARATIGKADEKVTGFLQKALDTVGTLTRMVSQILDVAELTRGNLLLAHESVDISALVEKTVLDIEAEARSQNITLSWKIEDMPAIQGDHERLKWAFEHLVRNAYMYTLPGGQMEVTANAVEGTCMIHVKDTGVGIDPRDLPRIFEQFYRGSPVASDGTVIDKRGAGQGLFIARSIIEAHGGEINVESTKGKGSDFTVLLPVTSSTNS